MTDHRETAADRRDKESRIARAIFERLFPLTNRIARMMAFANFETGDDMDVWLRSGCRQWAHLLVADPDDNATLLARTIVETLWEDKPAPPEFWQSELGQLILDRSGFPRRSATIAEAAAML